MFAEKLLLLCFLYMLVSYFIALLFFPRGTYYVLPGIQKFKNDWSYQMGLLVKRVLESGRTEALDRIEKC